MIKHINLIRNIGQFHSVSSGSKIPFSRMTLIYAENGRGKTTLTAILRSLATSDPQHITERKRLSVNDDPEVIIECIEPNNINRYQKGSWNQKMPEIVIFDDQFVEDNVCSGLEVQTAHRQNLHELILGSRGVDLNRRLKECLAKIEEHNQLLKKKANEIPQAERFDLNIDAFCSLQNVDDIDLRIKEAEQRMEAVKNHLSIKDAPRFDEIGLPLFDTSSLNDLLRRGLPSIDSDATQKVKHHFERIGSGGENWISEGYHRLNYDESGKCPFCDQFIDGSVMIEHYRIYFSDAYSSLKHDIDEQLVLISQNHSDQAQAYFDRSMRKNYQLRSFWSQFCDIPEISIDIDDTAKSWRAARDAVIEQLQDKQKSPLESNTLTQSTVNAINRYHECCSDVFELNKRLKDTASAINLVIKDAESSNLNDLEFELVSLKRTRERYTTSVVKACDNYLMEKRAKFQTEKERDRLKEEMKKYRNDVFPLYEKTVNEYLIRFNACYKIGRVEASDSRTGPFCKYNAVINDTSIPIGVGRPDAGNPTFRTALSSGDRNTLALSFFFASIDLESDLADKIVVIDDPVTSLDDHRSLATVNEIRRLAKSSKQVIILSHNKTFLCRLANHPVRSDVSAIKIIRDDLGSNLIRWDLSPESLTEHDHRYTLMCNYLLVQTDDPRKVAEAIRPHIEAFIRVAYPEHFQPGSLLGQFLNKCKQKLLTSDPILPEKDVETLNYLIEYANRFHHDTNAAWETAEINDNELKSFVDRTIKFTRR